MSLPDKIILSFISGWYALLIAYIIYREVKAAREMRMHVGNDGRIRKGMFKKKAPKLDVSEKFYHE